MSDSDADLIAAAPELLAALERAIADMEGYMAYHREKFYPADAPVVGLAPTIGRCRAALASARGEGVSRG